MSETVKNEMIYLVTLDIIKRLAKEKKVELSVLERLNCKNAEQLMCNPLPIS